MSELKRHYEIVFLVHPDQSDQVASMVERYQKIIVEKHNGSIHRQEDWGRRSLAYPMRNNVHKAHYMLLNIECNQAALNELESAFRFNDAILRYLIRKRDCAITEVSHMLKDKSDKKPRFDNTSRFGMDSKENDSLEDIETAAAS